MFKKTSFALSLLLILFAGGVQGKNLECNFDSELGGGIEERISEIRERAFDSCLRCKGSSCEILIYPPESDPAKFCKRVFCTPKKIHKISGEEIPTGLQIGKSKIRFNYSIDRSGSVSDLKVTELKGSMDSNQAYRWVKGLSQRVEFFPLKVNSKRYEITNLSGSIFVNIGEPSSPRYAKKDKVKEKPRKVDTDNKLIEIASGTGFLINKNGYFISNNHVVEICREIKTKKSGEIFKVRILATDEVNDLALGKINLTNSDFLRLSSEGGALGEEIIVSGFPFQGVLSESVKITKGVISSLSGPGNNYSLLQIDAAVQPGNSGGPILNQQGEVVGVTVSKADAFAVLSKFGTLPENVNFGIKIEMAKSFLKANNVALNQSIFQSELSSVEIASLAQKSTIHLQCWNTLTAAREIFQSNKARNLLVEVD